MNNQEHEGVMRIFRDNKLVGTMDVRTLKLKTRCRALRTAYEEAVGEPGMFELGDPHAPQPEASDVIVDLACWTRLTPDIEALYAFRRYLRSKNFEVK
jgi:hypothetical protein